MTENQTKQVPNTTVSEEQTRQRNAARITLVTFALMVIVAIVNAFLVPNDQKTLIDNYAMPFMAVSSGLSYVLVRRDKLTGGILVLLASTFLIAFIYPFVADNVGWQAAIGMMLITTTIANVTLPARTAGRVAVAALLLAMLIILIELYVPGVTQNAVTTSSFVITTGLSLIYVGIILARFRLFSLRTKMAVVFIGISLLPVLLLGVQSTYIARINLTRQVSNDLAETAKTTARSIGTTLQNELNAIGTEAQILDLVDYLGLPVSERVNSVEESRAYTVLFALQRKEPNYIVSYALLDKRGMDVLDTSPVNIGTSQSGSDFFRAPFNKGVPFNSPVRISQTTKDSFVYFSAPVKNLQGEIIGVLRSEHKALFLQDLLKVSSNADREEEYAVLVDNETFVRLADTGNQDSLFKTYVNLSAEKVRSLQNDLRLPPGAPGDVIAPETEVAAGIRNLENQPVFTAPSLTYGSAPALTAGFRVENANWTVLVRRTERSALAPLKDQTRAVTVASLLIILIAAGAGTLAAQILARPLVQLSGIAKEITQGNLDARAKVQSQDEIGTLAVSFNRMTDQLQDTLGSLEKRVAERTVDLEISRRQSEKRAAELQTIGEISSIITGEQKIEILLPLVTRLVSERFDFYHVGIFLIDATKHFAVLQAANSSGGQTMLARGHKLELGATSIVGFVAKFGEPRIALDVGNDAVFFNNPDLPRTRSEMALPLNSRGQIIGILDVQSNKPGAFTETDSSTLTILADQIAIAIENARLLEQTQKALSEAEGLYGQYIRENWASLAQEESLVGYHQTLIGGQKLTEPVDSDEIREAINRGRLLVLHADGDKTEPTIVMPLKLRGQIIGALNIKAPSKDRRWSQDEIDLAEAISERLSLALENARLIQDSQRQAIKEQTIGDITSKIGASINMRNVLQTAVEELGHSIPGSQVEIRFPSLNGDGQSETKNAK